MERRHQGQTEVLKLSFPGKWKWFLSVSFCERSMPSNDRHCPLLILSHLHSFWEKNCNSANSSGQLGNGIASSWQGWFISANTIVLASSRLFRSPWFLSRIFFSKRPTARIHCSGEPAQRLSQWKRTSDIETGASVRSLGSRAFFDPSTDNRHFSDCGRFVFPAVFHVRRHTQILGVWRAESFLSCGYFPVFLVSIHLGSGIWDRTSNEQQRRLSKVSRASLTLPRVAFLPEFFFLSVSITFFVILFNDIIIIGKTFICVS